MDRVPDHMLSGDSRNEGKKGKGVGKVTGTRRQRYVCQLDPQNNFMSQTKEVGPHSGL